MSIDVKQLTKKFGEYDALKAIDLEVKTGELVALLGPSGSGKTTLLRIIAGLEIADEGDVLFFGSSMSDVDVRHRQVGFVFQHYALFKHMTVFDNIAFGLRVKPRSKRPSESDIKIKVTDLLNLVQLPQLADRYPSQLSGGQRQRIALARALAIDPKVLLLDEPFGALDAKVRKELRQWLRRLHDELPITTVFVTHDVEEAMEVADRVAVMRDGCIEQIGTPDDVYHQPRNPFVYNFIGNVNLFKARSDGSVIYSDEAAAEDSPVIYVRPHLLDIHIHKPNDACFSAVVKQMNTTGPLVKVELSSHNDGVIHVDVPFDKFQTLSLTKDQNVYITIKESHSFVGDYSI
jgi:sulfate transport system ATP-binding protein